jgi:hypothetical protein
MLNDKAGINPQGEEEAVTNRQTDDDGAERGEKYAKQTKAKQRTATKPREGERIDHGYLSTVDPAVERRRRRRGDQRGIAEYTPIQYRYGESCRAPCHRT